MSQSKEQLRQKEEARAQALHHMHNSAVDGPHHDMPTHERMYQNPYPSDAEKYMMEGC